MSRTLRARASEKANDEPARPRAAVGWLVGVAVVAAVSCTSGGSSSARPPVVDEPAVADGTTIPVVGGTVVLPSYGDPVASEVERVPFDAVVAGELMTTATDRSVPLAFALRSCRDHGAGQLSYEVQWRGTDDVQLPLDLVIWVGPGGLAYQDGGGALYEVTVEREGTFVLGPDPVGPAAGDLIDEVDGVSAGRPPALDECSMIVVSEDMIDDQTEPGIGYEPADVPARLDADVEGSLQAHASDAYPIGPLLRDLLVRLGDRADLLPDRLWTSLTDTPESVSIQRQELCWLISSRWSDPEVTLLQRRGCPPLGDPVAPEVRAVVDDPAWEIVVVGTGPVVDEFAARLVALPVTGAEAQTPSGVGFDPLGSFLAELQAQGIEPIGQLDWGPDGTVVVVSRAGGIGGELELALFDPERLNVGLVGLSAQADRCVATIGTYGPGERVAVIAHDDARVARVEVREPTTGEWSPVEFEGGTGGVRLGLVTGEGAGALVDAGDDRPIRGFDSTGVQLDCVR